jgi:hypothetical protein
MAEVCPRWLGGGEGKTPLRQQSVHRSTRHCLDPLPTLQKYLPWRAPSRRRFVTNLLIIHRQFIGLCSHGATVGQGTAISRKTTKTNMVLYSRGVVTGWKGRFRSRMTARDYEDVWSSARRGSHSIFGASETGTRRMAFEDLKPARQGRARTPTRTRLIADSSPHALLRRIKGNVPAGRMADV